MKTNYRINVNMAGIALAWAVTLVGASVGIALMTGVVSGQSEPVYGCGTEHTAPSSGASTTELRAVSFSSSNDGWAVGVYTGPSSEGLYAIRWDGNAWNRVAVPEPRRSPALSAVTAISKDDVWAVGHYIADDSRDYRTRTLTMHWDGRQWQQVPINGPGDIGQLRGVSGVSANNVWAVGSYYSPNTRSDQSMILHWDGRAWSPVEIPDLTGQANFLRGVSARAANDVWAVGSIGNSALFLHWDGSTWSRVPAPILVATLSGVTALGPDNAWAVGGNAEGAVVMRWDGRAWSVAPTPPSSGRNQSRLHAVTALSATDAWAVGATAGEWDRASQLLVMRWDGRTWSNVNVPVSVWGHTVSGLDIASTSNGDIWIVGGYFDLTRNLRVPLIRQIKNTPCPPPTPTVATVTAVPTVRKPLDPPVDLPGSGSRTFPETGKTVKGIFLDYWNRNGGLAQQGYPISDLIGEVSELDRKLYTMQYFERAVFEYHPENRPPYNVLLSQLGTFQYKKKYPNGAPNQRPNTDPGTRTFPQTGKHLGGAFHHYWLNNGGLPQQGYPISDEFTEVSPLDGKTYTVQYFERAVFEYHPENRGTPHEVLLSHLGRFRWVEKYGAAP